MAHPYTEHFIEQSTVSGYFVKFEDPIDQLRHEEEVRHLSSNVRGRLFDCSIGTGRLVNALHNVSEYAGMDASPSFVALVQAAFPNVKVRIGDLLEGIDDPDSTYDTVICLRTLFALGHTEKIVREMIRIAKPGGTIVFDYGVQPRNVVINGHEIVTSESDIERIIEVVGVSTWEAWPLDGILVQIKRSRVFGRLASMLCVLPLVRKLLLFSEKLSLKTTHDRVLYILRV